VLSVPGSILFYLHVLLIRVLVRLLMRLHRERLTLRNEAATTPRVGLHMRNHVLDSLLDSEPSAGALAAGSVGRVEGCKAALAGHRVWRHCLRTAEEIKRRHATL
jgi:hypothetical protein